MAAGQKAARAPPGARVMLGFLVVVAGIVVARVRGRRSIVMVVFLWLRRSHGLRMELLRGGVELLALRMILVRRRMIGLRWRVIGIGRGMVRFRWVIGIGWRVRCLGRSIDVGRRLRMEFRRPGGVEAPGRLMVLLGGVEILHRG